MTEIPADLLEALARELAPYDFGPRDTTSDRHEPPRALLAALAEWADGALIDPSTWQRVTAKQHDRWWDPVESEIVRTCVFSHHVPLYTLTREDRHADPT